MYGRIFDKIMKLTEEKLQMKLNRCSVGWKCSQEMMQKVFEEKREKKRYRFLLRGGKIFVF